jgi:cation transport regulator ChaC
MSEAKIWVFFYGSYMNRAVLREVDLVPEAWEPASLLGFDIRIAPRANLVRSSEHTVDGVLGTATHTELERLYSHARDVLGESYLPQAVLAQTRDGVWRAPLCYIAPAMAARHADPADVDRILEAARELGLPASYLARLESFRG